MAERDQPQPPKGDGRPRPLSLERCSAVRRYSRSHTGPPRIAALLLSLSPTATLCIAFVLIPLPCPQTNVLKTPAAVLWHQRGPRHYEVTADPLLLKPVGWCKSICRHSNMRGKRAGQRNYFLNIIMINSVTCVIV